LSRYIKSLAAAGLCQWIGSLDSADLVEHEHSRGLGGLGGRLAKGIALARNCGLPWQPSLTVRRLVRCDGFAATWHARGFCAVSFSYPRAEPFGSTSLVYSADSHLVDLDHDELLDALASIARLRERFSVLNPRASLAEVALFVRGEQQAVPCIGGFKYFY